MEDEEMLETTNETENVETETTEEIQEEVNTETLETEVEETEVEETKVEEKLLTFTQEKLNEMMEDRVRREKNTSKRNEANIRREYEEKLADIENIIKAGFGTNNLDEGLTRITELCKSKGITIPERKASYSQGDLEVLANHAANEIIADGYDAVDLELKKLANKGVDKMTSREKLIFSKLNDTKKVLDSEKELASIGVKPEILQSKEFKDFADKFTGSKFSMKEVYEIYAKEIKPKPKAKPIGSMVNNNPGKVKDFISEAEYDKMTDKEIEENMPLIRKSMLKWR
ncbi:MAG: hypothetical protein IJ272_04650 [Clostridia bacterium]|nr:hypothetical protein [Clostridia bacterium]